MLGAPGKVLAAAQGTEIIVTEGNVGSSLYGFANDGLFGSFGGVAPSTYQGIVINGIYMTDDAQDEFVVWLEGNLPQDTFRSVRTQDGNFFQTADADSFQYSGEYNFTAWQWDTSKPASWDGSGTQTLTFNP